MTQCRNIRAQGSESMDNSTISQRIWGSIFVVFGVTSFAVFLYAAVVSKIMPLSDNPFISAIQRDRYYCFLVPLSVPVLVVAVYFHWLSMKLFKHA
ncbi:hypothetical protein RND81_09G237900 [Saponaria officinalis]|uniref:Phosphatidylinositol N-acetylglucosaminyltransferase subunit Y n=1 Tax=Saponaria officinalis TaxID=3572 RepID=A0AAW1IQ33_SAPOF